MHSEADTMSTKYYIAADGGGSKLLAILYDENYNVIRHCKLSGVNALFKPVSAVCENISKMLDILLSDDIKEVEAADICFVCNESVWGPIIKNDPRIKSTVFRAEPVIALAAAFMRNGAIALSGTGSDALMVKDGKCVGAIGGWGPMFGDEGSGYDIGLRSIKAALLDHDARGEKTMLKDMVFHEWKANRHWDIIFELAKDPDYRHKVASVTKLTGEAANAGDKVAKDIFRYAADELVSQTVHLIRRFSDDWNQNIVIMGGAWKSYHGMFEHYKSKIKELYPNATVKEPVFEPVVGCAVCRVFDSVKNISDDLKDRITRGFSDFLYKNQ
jgi:N-acetylglucosamine kinase-like BadF-type ATPase